MIIDDYIYDAVLETNMRQIRRWKNGYDDRWFSLWDKISIQVYGKQKTASELLGKYGVISCGIHEGRVQEISIRANHFKQHGNLCDQYCHDICDEDGTLIDFNINKFGIKLEEASKYKYLHWLRSCKNFHHLYPPTMSDAYWFANKILDE